MKEIILLLIVSQELSYCLSATKFNISTSNGPKDKFREILEIQKNNKCWKVGRCYTPGARCGSELLCKCHNHRYPIPIPKTSQCLDYRTLKEVCLIGEQCSQTENSICFGGKPIDIMTDDFVKTYLIGRGTNKHLFGVCQCRSGFVQMNGRCYQFYFDNLNCSRSIDCDSNVLFSDCDLTTNRCHCHPGYFYNLAKNQCLSMLRLFPMKIGGKCHFDYNCIDFDKNSECDVNHICNCKTSYTFSPISGKCKEYVPNQVPYHTWSYDTETLPRYQTNSGRGWKVVLVVFVIFSTIFRAVVRGRDDSGHESQREERRENSDNNRSILRRPAERYANRPWNQRRNTLDTNQSPNVEVTNQHNFVALPLSLPEISFDTFPDESLPPPYPDELPTYEEAMDMSAVRK